MHGGHDDSHGGHGPGGHKAHGPNAQHLKDHGGGSHGDKPCEGHDNYDELDDFNTVTEVDEKAGGIGGDIENVNERAAYIHVIGDLVQSVGVIIAAAIILWKPDYEVADPICTFIFSIIVFFTTTHIVGELMSVIMEATPHDFSYEKLRKRLLKLDQVKKVHDLHIW